jgi:serine/threonine protein kinase
MNSGDRFGRYEIIHLLGRGAMGEVYLAADTELRRQIALKLVYKGPHPEDQEVLDAERLGAELQKRLSACDPRVVVVNRYGEINGDLFIDMEYIEGEDLAGILARGPVQPGFAIHVAGELCEMLDNLRAFTTEIGGRQFAGVIHGDLKPRNIRINAQNHVKVVDFGIAKALADTRRYTMNVFASTAYCSPERLETQHIDARSDLWSVGVLLFQMLAGRLPFEEANKERLERRIRSWDPPDPLPESVPEPLRRIVFKMLARDPAQRYASATEVKAELMRFREGQPVLAERLDEYETVRTGPLAFDDDATIRTGPPESDEATTRSADSSPSLPDDATVRSAAPVSAHRTVAAISRGERAAGCFAALAVSALLCLGFLFWQMNVWKAADRLSTDLRAERISNLDEAWTRYQDLSAKTHMPLMLSRTKGALKKRLVAAADAIIAEYRNNDSPTVYEAQWIKARDQLAHALELDPDDNVVKGKLRVCEGHIERIRAYDARGTTRLKRLNSAIAKFREAADLLKKSPDPYLGLARIYVYDLGEVDRAEEALDRAAKNGHAMGKRELSQLGDAYRRRADQFWRESRAFTGAPAEEREYLDRARADYMRADDLYQRAGLYGNSPKNQLAAIQGRQRVEQRLNELQGGFATQ